jgi:predicted metalloendopeptidase
LSLGDRDYYSDNDTRNGYSDHITRMFTLLGDTQAASIGNEILDFESAIAEFTLPLDQLVLQISHL